MIVTLTFDEIKEALAQEISRKTDYNAHPKPEDLYFEAKECCATGLTTLKVSYEYEKIINRSSD